jgi:iron complex transport system ATP-binding protein
VSGEVRPALLELRRVELDYGRGPVLRGVDLRVGRGELVGLIGPNGAGKSSLLRCITGTAPRHDGTVLIDGRPLAEYGRAALARQVAVVPGQAVIGFPIRVEELVALGRLPHEHPLLGPRAADRAAIDAAIERVGIDQLRGRDVRQLSLGERQLALLAMAVAQDARLLLLDEPTVHLDLRHQVAIMRLLREIADAGVTVLAVLHDVNLARHFMPRLLLLDGGRLVADGPPPAVLTAERIGAVYGVDAALVGIVADGAGTVDGQAAAVRTDAEVDPPASHPAASRSSTARCTR